MKGSARKLAAAMAAMLLTASVVFAAEDALLEGSDGRGFGKWQISGEAFGTRPIRCATDGNDRGWAQYFAGGRR